MRPFQVVIDVHEQTFQNDTFTPTIIRDNLGTRWSLQAIFDIMALDAKMVPSMQVDFLVSSQEAKAEGTASNFKESSMFMVGGR
jgi:hypothetical protein